MAAIVLIGAYGYWYARISHMSDAVVALEATAEEDTAPWSVLVRRDVALMTPLPKSISDPVLS